MVRNLFIEPNQTPALNGAKSTSDNDGTQIISAIAGAATNPTQLIGPAVMGVAKALDETVDTTPGAARMLMAYTIGAPTRGPRSQASRTLTNECATRLNVGTGKSLLVNPPKEE